jgi:hypothetical protein
MFADYRGLYIKSEFFEAVAPALRLAVVFDVFGMDKAVMPEVAGMMSEPLFHAKIVVAEIVGIGFSPRGVIVGLESFAARGVVTGVLTRPKAGVGHK